MEIEVRRAYISDARFVYDLRFNDESVVDVSWDKSKPDYENHIDFFKNHLDDYSIILVDGVVAGFVRKTGGEVSIALMKGFRDKGIGTRVLNGFSGRAEVMSSNMQSYNCFSSAGFRLVGFILKKESVSDD